MFSQTFRPVYRFRFENYGKRVNNINLSKSLFIHLVFQTLPLTLSHAETAGCGFQKERKNDFINMDVILSIKKSVVVAQFVALLHRSSFNAHKKPNRIKCDFWMDAIFPFKSDESLFIHKILIDF